MFELIEKDRRAGHRKFTTVAVSVLVHVVVVSGIIIIPLLYVTDQLPTPNDVISAFAVNAPAPAPPPPPPPPPPSAPASPKPVATTGQPALAPVQAPSKIETPTSAPAPASEGVPGGVPGGIAGGVAGGVVGGIPEAPPAVQAPVRVGGQIKAPALVHRVDPQYPSIAQSGHVAGVVVLEATVDTSGRVESVHVLRGIPLLNDAAVQAVKQWRYSPLMLNGRATPFILTVTVTFALQ